MSRRTEPVEEITLSDSDSDDEPQVVDSPSAGPPNIVFFPQFQAPLMGGPFVDSVSDVADEVYPENFMVYEQPLPEQPPEQSAAPSGFTPDVLNPFACDFEKLSNFYFGAPVVEEVPQQKKKYPRHPASRVRTKQQEWEKLEVNAVVAKAQLQRLACSDTSASKAQKSRKRPGENFNNPEFELLKDVSKKDCYVSLSRLTLETLMKNNASRSSINLFKNFPQRKVYMANSNKTSNEKVKEIFDLLKSKVGQAEASTWKLIQRESDSNPKETLSNGVENEKRLGSQIGNCTSIAMKNHIQARIAQLIMSHDGKDAANKTEKTGAVHAQNLNSFSSLKNCKIKMKDCKVILKDLKREEFVKIGKRLLPVAEILSQCSSSEAKENASQSSVTSKSQPVQILEGQLLCEKTGCPLNQPSESEPSAIIEDQNPSEPSGIIEDQNPSEPSPIIISQDQYLDDQTGYAKTKEPQSNENESAVKMETQSKPRLMVRKDLFAPVPRAICEPPVVVSPYIICEYGKDTAKKSEPVEPINTRSSPSTATTFKTQLKNKLFSSLKTDTNLSSTPKVDSQSNTIKTIPVYITKFNGFKRTNTNGIPVNVIADKILSYQPKNKTLNSCERNQQKQHCESSTVGQPCPKSKEQNPSAIHKMFNDSSDLLNNNRTKQPVAEMPVEKSQPVNSVSGKRHGNATSELDTEENEPLPNEKSRVLSSDNSERRNSHGPSSVKQVSKKSGERSNFKIKMCTVVIEDCEKLVANKSSEQDSDGSSRSDSSASRKEASSRLQPVENTKSPRVSEKSRSKSPQLPEENWSKSPQVPEMDQSRSAQGSEVNRSRSPQVQQVNKSKSSQVEEIRRSRSPEVQEVNRSQSPEAEDASQSSSPELTRRPKSTQFQQQTRSSSPEVQEVNSKSKSLEEEECRSRSKEIQVVNIFRSTEPRKRSRSRSINIEMPSTSKASSPDVRLGKRSSSCGDGDECSKKKQKSDDSSMPEKINPTVFDVPGESFTSQSVLDDLFSVDGTVDNESYDKDFRYTSKVIQRKKVRKSLYGMLAKEIFGLNVGTCQKLALNDNVLSMEGVCGLGSCDIGTNCNKMVVNSSKIERKCKNLKISYDHFEMKLFDVVEGIPIGGNLLNEYHLDGNFDSETSDDEVLIKKKARLKTKNRLPKSGPKNVPNHSENQRRSSRNLPDSSGVDCNVLLTDFVVDKSLVRSSLKKSSGSLNVDERPTKPVSTSKSVESIPDEKLSDRKPVIKVIRLNYEKVKDGISVMDLDRALSATSRSTSVNRRKQGKPRKYGFNINSRNGGVKSPSKLVSDLHFMVRNPKKRSK